MDKTELYQKFFKTLQKCNPTIRGNALNRFINAAWDKLKKKCATDEDLVAETKAMMASEEKKLKQRGIFKFFSEASPAAGTGEASTSGTGAGSSASMCSSPSTAPAAAASAGTSTASETMDRAPGVGHAAGSAPAESETSDVDDPDIPGQKPRPCPAQDVATKQIQVMEATLNGLLTARRTGLSTLQTEKRIKEVSAALKQQKKMLAKKRGDAERSRKARLKKKRKLEKVCEDNPEVGKVLKAKADVDTPGRPSLTDEQPALLATIVEIVNLASGAEGRRRDERLNACQTLDELRDQLGGKGFHVSRSGLYYHLLPKNPTSREGRRHVETAPVRLIKAQTSHHKEHVDSKFATASIRYLESLASYLGPRQVLFISQDDKARVPIGKTAAKAQSPMLMSLKYKVSLPDHDFPVGPGHKLIPSVMGIMDIKEEGLGKPEAVTYSGPTYISIRSGKHSSSTASTHADDFGRLIEVKEFERFTKTPGGRLKPVVIMSVDGGPDECPRYEKNILYAIEHFRTHQLDAIFVVANAPGRSAYNRVERRMAPLSYRMAGLLLPHDTYGNHLDGSGNTVDEEMELRNFQKAGQTLAELWSDMTIDGHPVLAEYIEPGEGPLPLPESPAWYAAHVRESQYLTQVVRCQSEECCGPPRSNLASFLRGFLPPPVRVRQTESGMVAVPPTEDGGHFLPLFPRLASQLEVPREGHKRVPYDMYCPSVTSMVSGRVCRDCGLYFASQERKKAHVRDVHKALAAAPLRVTKGQTSSRVRPAAVLARRGRELLCFVPYDHEAVASEWVDEDEVDVVGLEVPEPVTPSPLIESLGDFLTKPWECC